MPVEDFQGRTFVAFMDISGFKEMMKGDGAKAIDAMDKMYSTGYRILRDSGRVNGFFVSDCGILFVNRNDSCGVEGKLADILRVVKRINRDLLSHGVMLTTSVAYGEFRYHGRIEFRGIQKSPIYGSAYVDAVLDHQKNSSRIQPGQCRVIARGLEGYNFDDIDCLKKIRNYFYYYWMVDDQDEIGEFEREYNDSYRRKYEGMLSALKKYTHSRNF